MHGSPAAHFSKKYIQSDALFGPTQIGGTYSIISTIELSVHSASPSNANNLTAAGIDYAALWTNLEISIRPIYVYMYVGHEVAVATTPWYTYCVSAAWQAIVISRVMI